MPLSVIQILSKTYQLMIMSLLDWIGQMAAQEGWWCSRGSPDRETWLLALPDSETGISSKIFHKYFKTVDNDLTSANNGIFDQTNPDREENSSSSQSLVKEDLQNLKLFKNYNSSKIIDKEVASRKSRIIDHTE